MLPQIRINRGAQLARVRSDAFEPELVARLGPADRAVWPVISEPGVHASGAEPKQHLLARQRQVTHQQLAHRVQPAAGVARELEQ